MGFPWSSRKRYLGGTDWVVNVLHHVARAALGLGMHSQVVLRLAGTPDPGELRHRLAALLADLPILRGGVARDPFNLAPYWRVARRGGEGLALAVADVDRDAGDTGGLLPCLAVPINEPFRSRLDHLKFGLLRCRDGRSCLSMTFDHRLLDARGAESLLHILAAGSGDTGDRGVRWPVAVTEPPRLDHWGRRFRAGQRLNRRLIELRGAQPRVLGAAGSSLDGSFRYRLLALDPAQSAAVSETAERQAGYLMLLPFLLEGTVRALHPVFERRGAAEREYLVPVSIEGRARRAFPEQALFNHLTFLFVRVPANGLPEPGGMARDIVRQVLEQYKAGLPDDIEDANLPMRIFPASLLAALGSRCARACLGSYFFSMLGEPPLPLDRFLGIPVEDLFHMPRLPAPPGVGLLFNRFRGRLNAMLTFLPGLLSDEEADAVLERLSAALLDGSGRRRMGGAS